MLNNQLYGMFWAHDCNQMDTSFHIILLDEVRLQIIILKGVFLPVYKNTNLLVSSRWISF
jgi:hypothetical protein